MPFEEGKSNLRITLRERGKLVTERVGHNIWLDTGRSFLAQVMSFASYPSTFQQTLLPRYVTFGIGGKKQNELGVANVNPCLSNYPGPNSQLDIDRSVTKLERPARISWTNAPSAPSGTYGNYVYDPADVWLIQVTPAIHPTLYSLEWTCSFLTTDFSSGPFLSVPLSEIGLVLSGASVNVYNNQVIAYDTFDSIPKTSNFTVDVSWTVRF